MKKFTRVFILIAFAMLLACGCAETNDAQMQPDNPAVGTWKLFCVVINGENFNGSDADVVLEGASSAVMTVELDGTFDLSINDVHVIGTYEVKPGGIVFLESETEFPIKVENDTLTIDLTEYAGIGMQYVFSKTQDVVPAG